MLSVGFVLERLKDHIIHTRMQVKTGDSVSIEGIAFADPKERYEAGTLLICEGVVLPELLCAGAVAQGVTILSTGDGEGLVMPNSYELNIIITPLSMLELYRLFSGALEETNRWERHLLETLLAHSDVQSILEETSALIDADVLLLAPDGRVLANCLARELVDPLLAHVLESGRLEDLKLAGVIPKPYYGVRNSDEFTRYTTGEGGRSYYLYHTRDGKGELLLSILLATNGDHLQTDVHALAAIVGRCVQRGMKSGRGEGQGGEGALHELFHNIIGERVSVLDIKRGLKLAPHPLRNFCAVGIVELEGCAPGSKPYGCVMRQLAEIFPDCNMLVYDGVVVILISFEDRSLRIEFDDARLQKLLERHDAYMGISNATRNRAMLRTHYLQCRDTIRLAKVLRTNRQERIFRHEDYSMYGIIDLCARAFQDTHHHDDLIYLIHPSIAELSRYDNKHNNNLLDVLYYYLLNGCNLIKTARSLYMHRNTVINKVNKIIEIIGCDLEDGKLQQRLMFSCQFIRYVSLYLENRIILN